MLDKTYGGALPRYLSLWTKATIGYTATTTLSNTGIDTRIIPAALQKRLPKYGDVPAIRLGRLAVDQRAQRQGIGVRLLANAVIRSVSNASAWALMVVDAKDDRAAAFYRKFGFDSLEDDALHLFSPRKDLELLFIDAFGA